MSLSDPHVFNIDSASQISESLMQGLQADFFTRRMQSGTSCLAGHRAAIETLDPMQKSFARMTGLLALWVEAGFSDVAAVRKLMDRLPDDLTKDFSVLNFVYFRLAQSLVEMASDRLREAAGHLDAINAFEEQAGVTPLVVIANFWIGKCYRKMGRYDEALRYIVKARRQSLQLGYEKMAAVISICEGWLSFKKGKGKEATQLLRNAEKVLLGTDDYVSLGNIQFAYARIARRERRYDAAIVHYTAAIAEFRRWTPPPPELARSSTNVAIVKQFIALQLQHKLDEELGRGRRSRKRRTNVQYIENLREEAQAHLTEAADIYRHLDDNHGIGTVHLSLGQVYLSSGELDRAGSEAEEAYGLGQNTNDYVLMARARVLGAMVENAKFEEQLDEPSPHEHAKLASQWVDEASEWATRVPNRRVLAKTLVAKSLILSNDFFNDREAAMKCAERAKVLFGPVGHDYLWQDLEAVSDRLHHFRGVNSSLREWSHGHVGNKSFRQITEEFAGIVIPKVWRLEDRKISRVATRLSISPKKVRRILCQQGLLKIRNARHDEIRH